MKFAVWISVVCLAALLSAQEAPSETWNVSAELAAARAEHQALQSQVRKARAELQRRLQEAQDSAQELQLEIQEAERALQEQRGLRSGLERELASCQKELQGLRGPLQLELMAHDGFDGPDGDLRAAMEECLRKLAHPQPKEAAAIDETGALVYGKSLEIGNLRYFANDQAAGILVKRDGSSYEALKTVDQVSQDNIRKLLNCNELQIIPVAVSEAAVWPSEEGAEAPAGGLWAHFRQGGAMMIPLGLLAWFGLMVALERLWFYGTHSVSSEVQRFREEKKTLAAPLLEAQARRRVQKAQRLLGALAVVAAVAPLLGLLGTVTGMIHTFQLISQVGTGDARQLAGGISEALVTTEAGLMIALPMLLFHAWCRQRVKRLAQALLMELPEPAGKGE